MQVEGGQKEPELRVSPVFTKEKEQQKEKKKSKLVGWSPENMEEKQRKLDLGHLEEMVQWRSVDQEGMNQMWKTLSKMKEEVLVKYKVEVSNRGAYKGRGEPSEWRIVQRVNKYQPWKWVKTVRRQSTSWFREYDLLRKACREVNLKRVR